MTWTFPILAVQAVSLLIGAVLTANAQTTCLPVDNMAKGIRARLIMYATATKDPYKAVRDSVKIPPITTAEVPTQLVQVTTGDVCAMASAVFNQRAMLMHPSDNNSSRREYLSKIGASYAVAGDYLGTPSDVSIFSSDFSTRYGSFIN